MGLLEPTSGRAEVLGFDTHTQADEVRTRTGALLEHPGVYEQLTAEDNLEFYGRVWRMAASERQARIKEHIGPLTNTKILRMAIALVSYLCYNVRENKTR